MKAFGTSVRTKCRTHCASLHWCLHKTIVRCLPIYIYFACQFCCQAEVQCRESGEFTWPLVATYGTSRGLCRLLGLQPPTELILLYQVGQNEQFTSELQTRPANAEGLYMAIPFTTLRQFSIIIFHMSKNSHVKQPGWTLLWRRR